ncbi:hypothetical protein LUZ63_021969 [Rhynchospora breviuscula]|uniref:DNA-directed DNA polymerase n=1 Tax=Rhynchospora breviuscula TaxID=2022672 RepID=A0A9P9Z3C0_9POAL|nr:hypothetical protein LUZ63_024012 [Rhynchospora breviuscula]KAJ1680991.1 hypothetical protein LUZ63_023788 [Rhynchospora breviuscula]KAJ1681739.1 hypothetical protein LUZ63_023041 [Rhynchospora breviuscula]KAJ1682811.1 hypothetical protein LUZ63_021969 [Rhynchospora breviuscula]
MLKAQEIHWKEYQIDISKRITLSSLAFTIFRLAYYAEAPISIPSSNADQFIRRGYYGGNAVVYIPRGMNLFYYDVNSLDPFVMLNSPMPTGKGVWHGDLQNKKLAAEVLLKHLWNVHQL